MHGERTKITGGIWFNTRNAKLSNGYERNGSNNHNYAENIFMLLGNKLLDDGVEEEVILASESPPTTQNGYGP